jgi:FMN hydrolase / 5-amino-6-(5-phospho-D-ribitylamino)uracil phosphatase
MTSPRAGVRWVCLDVGETLIDETRVWSVWAEALGIPAMTFLAAFGAVVDRGLDHAEVFDLVGAPDWRLHAAEIERRYGGFQAQDLYPDALPAMDALRADGYRLAVVANQPAVRDRQLRAIGVAPDVMAMSESMGVAKPDPAFFSRALELMGGPSPADVAYVGDRPDNDVRPASAAGMRAVWLRRGPWGVISSEAPEAHLVVRSLHELVERIDEVWPTDPAGPPLA